MRKRNPVLSSVVLGLLIMQWYCRAEECMYVISQQGVFLGNNLSFFHSKKCSFSTKEEEN